MKICAKLRVYSGAPDGLQVLADALGKLSKNPGCLSSACCSSHASIVDDVIIPIALDYAEHGEPESTHSILISNILLSAVKSRVGLPFDLDGAFSGRCISYILLHWDYFIDIVRHQACEIFVCLLQQHSDFCNQCRAKQLCTGLRKIVQLLDSSSSHIRSRYVVLKSLVGKCKLNVHCLLHQLRASFQSPILWLTLLNDQTLASYIADLYVTWSDAHVYKMEVWLTTWNEPIRNLICSGSEAAKTQLMQQLLPLVAKRKSKLLSSLAETLSSTDDGSTDDESVLFALLTVVSTQMTTMQGAVGSVHFTEFISEEILTRALCHADIEIALTAFHVLCLRPKSTAEIDVVDFVFVKLFLICHVNSENSSCRQRFLADFKWFLVCIRDSGHFHMHACIDKEEVLPLYFGFVRWLFDFCFDSLFVGANFIRCAVALQLLTYFLDVLCTGESAFAAQMISNDWFTDYHMDILSRQLLDAYESNQVLALDVIVKTHRLFGVPVDVAQLLARGRPLLCSNAPQNTASGAYLYLCAYMQHHCSSENSVDAQGIVKVLLSDLEREIGVANRSLLHAASTAPMYGVISCLALLLAKSGCMCWSTDDMGRVVRLCFEASDVVAVVVNSLSPEGSLPIHACYGGDTPGSEGEDSSTSSQALLVCAWRTMKEVGYTLGLVVERIGEWFMQQLSNCKHRGAFETIQAGFAAVCSTLHKHYDNHLRSLPGQWLMQVLDSLERTELSSGFCATRRSAGLPFMVAAILSTEHDAGAPLLHSIFPRLFSVADTDGVVFESRVHALNILRILFRDARLDLAVFPYIAQGIQIAITGYLHPRWAVRNAAQLLFSSLMPRIFGVTRAKHSIGRKNSMSEREFFGRYPTLYEFLLRQMRMHLDSTDLNRIPRDLHNVGALPILILLSRLYPSAAQAGKMTLEPFCHAAFCMCISSPVWIVRSLAARCLVSLRKDGEHLLRFITSKLSSTQAIPSNRLHGYLLILKELLSPPDSCSRTDSVDDATLCNLRTALSSCSARTASLCVQAACMELLTCMPSVSSSAERIDTIQTTQVDSLQPSHRCRQWEQSTALNIASTMFVDAFCGVLRTANESLVVQVLECVLRHDSAVYQASMRERWDEMLSAAVNLVHVASREKLIRKTCKLICILTVDRDVNRGHHADVFREKWALMRQEKTRVWLVTAAAYWVDANLCACTVPVNDWSAWFRECVVACSFPHADLTSRRNCARILARLLARQNSCTGLSSLFYVSMIRLLLDEEPSVRHEMAQGVANSSLVVGDVSYNAELALAVCLRSMLTQKENKVQRAVDLLMYLVELADCAAEIYRLNLLHEGRVFDRNELNNHLELPSLCRLVHSHITRTFSDEEQQIINRIPILVQEIVQQEPQRLHDLIPLWTQALLSSTALPRDTPLQSIAHMCVSRSQTLRAASDRTDDSECVAFVAYACVFFCCYFLDCKLQT